MSSFSKIALFLICIVIMIQTLFTNWHLMRWLRLLMGLLALGQAIAYRDAFIGAFAAFFLFQALANSGCCGATGCDTRS